MSGAFISVLKKPGAMPLTCTFDGAISTASARVIILSAPLLTAYGTMFGPPMSLASEQMLMILPRRRDCMPRTTARVTRNGPSVLVAHERAPFVEREFRSGLRWFIAALLTRMSIAPIDDSISATFLQTAASSVTSNALMLTACPRSASDSIAASSFAWSRPLITTRAPAWRGRRRSRARGPSRRR
jgi:hypothetical protein